ncbi:hypothetical protein ABE073_15415 [Lederbergia citrisecunda]|uniref:hypothetical protein n=1 Tax=Lederbergia citrisecunda TaxID=2833583 RepID=UPI003D287A94
MDTSYGESCLRGRNAIKKWLPAYVPLIGLLLFGCADGEVVAPPHQPTEMETAITLKPDLQVHSGDNSIRAIYDKHCWETAEKTCSLVPTPAQEILEHEPANQVKVGDELHFRFSIPMDDIDFPSPDAFKLVIHKDGETTAVEVDDDIAQAPLAEGRYFMSVKAIWSGDVKGEAIYAFLLSAKEN